MLIETHCPGDGSLRQQTKAQPPVCMPVSHFTLVRLTAFKFNRTEGRGFAVSAGKKVPNSPEFRITVASFFLRAFSLLVI